MDLPTYIVTFAAIASAGLYVILKRSHVSRKRVIEIQLSFVSIVWAIITTFGEFIYSWAGNATCSKYLGCVEGFGGYDAVEHLFFAAAAALAIVWACERYPKYSILHSALWKNALTVIAVIALSAVFWEILECANDALRVDILHESLRNFRLHINLLAQPTNLDTMGDLTFGVIGSIVGFIATL